MKDQFKILSVNISEKRGRKFPVEELVLNKDGAKGDAHASTVRPVSIIDYAEAELFKKLTGSRNLEYGECAENITAKKLHDFDVKIFDCFICKDVVLEVVKIGKPFHRKFREPGNYIMPRVGIFCRVRQAGVLMKDDILDFSPKIFKVFIITLSDRASKGDYDDESGPLVMEIIENYFSTIGWRIIIEPQIIPDEPDELRKIFAKAKSEKADLIITTGGTGIGPRDITPDIAREFIDKEIPGIMEMIRLKYGVEKPNALLSRGVAGVMGETLVYTLPGSVKAVKEYTAEILKTLQHLIFMLHNIDVH